MIDTKYFNRRAGALLSLFAAVLFAISMTPASVSAGDSCGIVLRSKSPLPQLRCEKPVDAPAAPVATDEVCVTSQTRVAISDRDVISVFSDFVDGNPNGMLITEISLSDVRAVSDEEKALNQPILVYSTDSEFADGWSVKMYWFDNHYSFAVSGEQNTFYDATSACANF